MGKLAIPHIATALARQTVDKYNGESGYQLVVESHKDGQIVAHRVPMRRTPTLAGPYSMPPLVRPGCTELVANSLPNSSPRCKRLLKKANAGEVSLS